MATTFNQMTKGRSVTTVSAKGLSGETRLPEAEFYNTEQTCRFLGISMMELIDLVRRTILVPHQIAGQSLFFRVNDLRALPKVVDPETAISALSRLALNDETTTDRRIETKSPISKREMEIEEPNSTEMLPEWISADVVTRYFDVSRKVVNKWAIEGYIRKHKNGSSRQAMVKYNTADIRNFMNGRHASYFASANGAA